MVKLTKKVFNLIGLDIRKIKAVKIPKAPALFEINKVLEVMDRTKIVQSLINLTKTEKYLEIGMGPGLNHLSINCKFKTCVDPTPTVPVTYSMTSDDFFKQNKEKFGVVFIDGLHWSEQVYKDILNSLDVLDDDGFVICHDMNPHSEYVQRYPQPQAECEWTGDCWKAWARIRSERNDLSMFVVDTDFGCGVITKGSQDRITLNDELTWEILDTNRNELLNLISFDEFNNFVKNKK